MARSRSALIILKNQAYLRDSPVKTGAAVLRDDDWRIRVNCPSIEQDGQGRGSACIYRNENMGGGLVHYYPMSFAAYGVYGHLREYVLSIFRITRLSWKVFQAHGIFEVQLFNPPDLLFVVGLLFKMIRKKVIFDQHDLFREMVLSRFHGSLRRVLYLFSRGMEFPTFSAAYAVISTNQSYRKIAIQRAGPMRKTSMSSRAARRLMRSPWNSPNRR